MTAFWERLREYWLLITYRDKLILTEDGWPILTEDGQPLLKED